jgi:hypothetical protein
MKKGYKIFNNDWTCNDFQYEVGKEYKYDGKIAICDRGFHFCKKLKDCFGYYACVPWHKIAEIEASGDIIESRDNSKCCTSSIKIVKEIMFDQVPFIIKKETINSKAVNRSTMIYNSEGVDNSFGVNCSKGISTSHGVNSSQGIDKSDGIGGSVGIYTSNGINRSMGICISVGISHSSGIHSSSGINASEGICNSRGVNCSKGISKSYGVDNSSGISNSIGILNCHGIDSSIFCSNIPKKHFLFDAEVSQYRHSVVSKNLTNILNKNKWSPTFNNLKSLYLKSGSEWKKTPITSAKELSKKEAWDDFPEEAIEYLRSLPEFNSKIFKKITGIVVEEEL